MIFYPDKKDGMSPSSIAMWLGSRNSFIKSYFKNEKIPETESMRAGTVIHRLIEGGMLEVKKAYSHSEEDISVTIAPGMIFRGRPDSWGNRESLGEAYFVDYKSGKNNEWKEKLPSDIKMRATAFLVWEQAKRPDEVIGFIEFIQTEKKENKTVPVENIPHTIHKMVYTAKEMEELGQVILKEMEYINKFYPKWEDRPDGFVSDAHIEEFVVIDQKIRELEVKKDSIKETILELMEFGGEENHITPYGTFYLTHKKKYEYPELLTFNVDGKIVNRAAAENIANGLKGAKKNYELAHDPVDTITSLGFRTKK